MDKDAKVTCGWCGYPVYKIEAFQSFYGHVKVPILNPRTEERSHGVEVSANAFTYKCKHCISRG